MRWEYDALDQSTEKRIEALEMGADIAELCLIFRCDENLNDSFIDWQNSTDNSIHVSFIYKYYPSHTVRHALMLFYINYVNLIGWSDAVQRYLRL